MHLLVPAFLGAAAILALPTLLNLLRIQPRKQIPFPSLLFLGRDALRDTNRQRLRRWLVLLLRFAFILLVIFAFSRPFWPLAHSENSRAVVVVVDNSFSMQAAGRREAVEAWLAPQLSTLRPPDQLGVLLLHPSPTWIVPMGDDLEAGRSVLRSLPQAYEATHYRAGLELAAAKLALSNLKQKQILLAADQQRSGWSGVRFERTLPPGVKLFPAPPALPPKRQAAITSLRATRIADGQISLDASVRSFSPGEDQRTVTFYAGGQKLGVQPCVLASGRPQTVHAEYVVPDPAAALMLHAALDADDLPVDDTAYIALAAIGDRRVLLASGNPGSEVDYLQLALESSGAGNLPAFRIDPLVNVRAWPPSSVAVLRGPSPFRAEVVPLLDGFLAAGGSAWMICDGSAEQNAWLATRGIKVSSVYPRAAEKLKWRDLALDHPLFAPFAAHSIAPLLTPTFSRGWSLDGDTVEPLARWLDRSIAIAEVPTGGGRLLVTGFGETRTDSNFPIGPGYLPFVHQAVAWLVQNQMAAPVGGRVGATLVLPGPGKWHAILTPKPVPTVEVNGYVTPTIPGLYAFEQRNEPSRFYAVNLDPAESDLSPWPTPADFARLVNPERPNVAPASPQADPKAGPVTDPTLIDERQTWWWLLVAAILVLFVELGVANRTIP